jgi:hypothetical protein
MIVWFIDATILVTLQIATPAAHINKALIYGKMMEIKQL